MLSPKEHCLDVRVYIEDTDVMGIVYHANYLKYLERARTEMLRSNGLNLTMMAVYDTHFAIHDIHIRYLYPARLDEILTIRTTSENIKASSLVFKQVIDNQADKTVCTAAILVVCVNKNLKPKRLPVEFFGGIKSG